MASTSWKVIYGTATTSGGVNPGRRPYVKWRVTSQNIANNTSRVEIIVGSQVTNGATWGTFNGTVTIMSEGRAVSGSVPQSSNADISGTLVFTVSHISNGARNMEVRLTGGISGTSGWVGTNLYASVALPTIPRASSVSVPASTAMGTAQKISITRASTSFTHDLSLRKTNGDLIRSLGTGVATTLTFTQPITDATNIPNATSGKFMVRCITKSGSTTIGTKNVQFTATVPASVIPTITSVSASDSTNGFSTVGAYLQNYSKVKPAATGAAGIHGSTIASYDVRLKTKTVNVATSLPAQNLTYSGTVTVGLRAVDSRGRKSAEVTTTITSIAYNPPTLSNVSIVRTNTASPPVPTALGTAAGIKTQGTLSRLYVSSTDKNRLTIQTHYRLKGASAWTSSTTIKNALNLASKTTWADTAYINTAAGKILTAEAYEVRLTVKDIVSTVYYPSSTTGYLVPMAKTALSVGTDGIGAGKIWSKGAIDIQGNIFKDGFGVTQFDDTRSTNELPSWYQTNFPRGEYREFKQLSVFGPARPAGATFGILTTTVPWMYYNAGYQVTQKMEISAGGVTWRLWRSSTSATVWGPWYGEGPNKLIINNVAYDASIIKTTPSRTFGATGNFFFTYLTEDHDGLPGPPAGYRYAPTLLGTNPATVTWLGAHGARLMAIGVANTARTLTIQWDLVPL